MLGRGRGTSGIWGLSALPSEMSTVNPNVSVAQGVREITYPGQYPLVPNPNAQTAVGDIVDTYSSLNIYCNKFLGQATKNPDGTSGEPPGKGAWLACMRYFGVGNKGGWTDDADATYVAKPVLPAPNYHFFTSAQRQTLTVYDQIVIGQSRQIAADAVASTLPAFTGCDGANTMATSPETWAPGVFTIAGVPFHVAELKDGRFDRSYKPNAEQRFWAERYVINASADWFARRVSSALGVTGPNPSIESLYNAIGLRTFCANMAWNPIQPTPEEWSNYGGYAKWIARGGYPLMQEVLDGKVKASDESIIPTVCASSAFSCSSDIGTPGSVSCMRAFIQKDGSLCAGGACSQNPGKGSAAFWIYIKIGPNQGDDYNISLIYDQPNKLQYVAYGMKWFLDKLAGVLCAATPVIQQQAQQAVAEHCIDSKTKKPCVKGAKNCACSTPQPSAQLAVTLSGYYMSQWCSDWTKQENPIPPQPPSPIPQPDPPTNYWPWLIGGALVVGGLLYSRNK